MDNCDKLFSMVYIFSLIVIVTFVLSMNTNCNEYLGYIHDTGLSKSSWCVLGGKLSIWSSLPFLKIGSRLGGSVIYKNIVFVLNFCVTFNLFWSHRLPFEFLCLERPFACFSGALFNKTLIKCLTTAVSLLIRRGIPFLEEVI